MQLRITMTQTHPTIHLDCGLVGSTRNDWRSFIKKKYCVQNSEATTEIFSYC